MMTEMWLAISRPTGSIATKGCRNLHINRMNYDCDISYSLSLCAYTLQYDAGMYRKLLM